MEATYIACFVLLCITYDHTHLEVDLHPAKHHTPRDHNTGQDLWMQNTKTQSIHLWYNVRRCRERLSPFDLWFDWDYFLRSLTSRSGSRDTNIQESDDWQHSIVRFSIVCRKGCSEIALHQMVSIWRIIKVSYTNKYTPGLDPEHSTFSCWWIVECFIEPVSWCNLVVHM